MFLVTTADEYTWKNDENYEALKNNISEQDKSTFLTSCEKN